MIIDIHTHTFPDRIAEHALAVLQENSHTVTFSDGTAEGQIERDRKVGISLAVVLPVATHKDQVRSVNDRAFRLNNSTSELLSFACIHPAMEDAEGELCRIKVLGIPGIKIHPVYQGTDIDSTPYLRILEKACELGLIVITHAGWDIGYPGADECLPEKIRRAVKAVDPEGKTLKFVAAHMGGWRCWKEVPEQLSDTGVYLDTSFSTGKFYPLDDGYYDEQDTSLLDQEQFMELYSAFGPERLLFGTDSPWSSAEESIQFIRDLPVSEEEKEEMLGGNAARLLEI